jgi:hypothetical protein
MEVSGELHASAALLIEQKGEWSMDVLENCENLQVDQGESLKSLVPPGSCA